MILIWYGYRNQLFGEPVNQLSSSFFHEEALRPIGVSTCFFNITVPLEIFGNVILSLSWDKTVCIIGVEESRDPQHA